MERQIENRLEMLTRLHSTDRIMLPLQEEKNRSFVQEVLVGLGRIKKTWSTD
jgi:hypothetical protein